MTIRSTGERSVLSSRETAIHEKLVRMSSERYLEFRIALAKDLIGTFTRLESRTASTTAPSQLREIVLCVLRQER